MAEGGAAQKPCADNQMTLNQMDVNECLGSWLTYLQNLNGLCSAGTKLALSLQALLSGHESGAPCRVTSQCLAGWEELTRATNVASHTVKKHVVTAMKDYEVLDNDIEKADILRDNLLTFINLQYQFCVACCKCLGSMAECSCTQDSSECDIVALQQCFERLYSSPQPVASSSTTPRAPAHNSHRSPLPYSLFPLQVQRRWSETAAADISGESAGGEQSTLRRWSMPWDCRHVSEWPRQDQPAAAAPGRVPRTLRVPGSERSRSTTPPGGAAADSLICSRKQQQHQHQQQQQRRQSAMQPTSSQDGLREAIQLLSCKPGVRLSSARATSYAGYVPGVTLTPCNYLGYESSSASAWPPDSVRSAHHSSSRCWPLMHDSHSSDHSDHSGVLDLFSSRKNSSSTDSCVSAHSRSGSESAAGAGESVISNLYSMWSGSDLPFIKLPETNEIKDDSNI